MKSEPLLRLLICDLVGEEVTRESLVTLSEDIADLTVATRRDRATTELFPHRRKYQLLVIAFLRRLLDLHEQLVAEVDRDFAAPGRAQRPASAAIAAPTPERARTANAARSIESLRSVVLEHIAHSPAHTLFTSALFELGEFRCWPDHPRWDVPNAIGGRPHVVFPGTSVFIEHAGRRPVLADRNFAILYNADDEYRRRLHDPRGDHCIFVAIEPGCFTELAGASGVTFTYAPGDPRAYLLTSAVVRRLRAGECDRLVIEETILQVVRRSLDLGILHHGERIERRQGTDDRHYDLVEAARAALAESPESRTSLDELARRLHVSAFHLARTFKARTGFTLRGYRRQLRLRLALDRIDEDGCDLAALAYELGFSSHSHFTDAFRSLFGAPPSRVRAAGTASRRELRKKVEAPLAGRS